MIEILFQDERVVAVNKPHGISVHDAPGPGSSLLRELKAQNLGDLTPVHRLDKDASGVLLLARSKEAASKLQALWPEARKTYLALCEGVPPADAGTIDALILENQTGKPERLASALNYFRKVNPGVEPPPPPAPKTSGVHPAGRPAQTDYRVLEKFVRFSWLEVSPRQGRMHQIRVHLSHAGCPLAVDSLYGQRAALHARDLSARGADEVVLARMPLHAAKLELAAAKLPVIEAPLPEDLDQALKLLRS